MFSFSCSSLKEQCTDRNVRLELASVLQKKGWALVNVSVEESDYCDLLQWEQEFRKSFLLNRSVSSHMEKN